MKNSFITKLIIFLFATFTTSSQALEVAITVDDLPYNGDLPPGVTRMDVANKMLRIFNKHHIKGIYGFVNGKKIQENSKNYEILTAWVKQRNYLGNHTFSHIDLVKVDGGTFIEDIKKNDPYLNQVMGNKKYFRYPFLAEGNTLAKRNAIRDYLFKHHYQVAPVTTDFFDYEWNPVYIRCIKKHDINKIAWLKKTYLDQAVNALTISHELSKMLFHRDIKNILLIHINAFNAEMLDRLLTEYEAHGVKFISLENALTDDVYSINPNIAIDRPYTFLNQIRLSRKLKNPKIVQELYDSLPENKLNEMCK